jgi:hypothetical protein
VKIRANGRRNTASLLKFRGLAIRTPNRLDPARRLQIIDVAFFRELASFDLSPALGGWSNPKGRRNVWCRLEESFTGRFPQDCGGIVRRSRESVKVDFSTELWVDRKNGVYAEAPAARIEYNGGLVRL